MDEIIAYLKNHPDKASEYAQIWEELLAVYPQLTSVNSQQEWQQFRREHSGIALEEDLWIYGPASLDESIQKIITQSLEEGTEETAADSNKQKKEVKPGLSLQRIVGTVTIKRGDEEKPVVNASVSVTNTRNKKRVQNLITDSRGHFQTKLLMPTRYLLVFRHPEFEGEEKKRVVNMKSFQPPLKILFKAPAIEPTPEDNAEDAPPPPSSAETPLSEGSSPANPTVIVSNNTPAAEGGNAIPLTERIGYSYEDKNPEQLTVPSKNRSERDTKIYSKPSDDPAYRTFLLALGATPAQASSSAAPPSSEAVQQFIQNYPEKAVAYANSDPLLHSAIQAVNSPINTTSQPQMPLAPEEEPYLQEAEQQLQKEYEQIYKEVEAEVIEEKKAELIQQYTLLLQEHNQKVQTGTLKEPLYDNLWIQRNVTQDLQAFTQGPHGTRGQIDPWGKAIQTDIDHKIAARFQKRTGRSWIAEVNRKAKPGSMARDYHKPAHADIGPHEIRERAKHIIQRSKTPERNHATPSTSPTSDETENQNTPVTSTEIYEDGTPTSQSSSPTLRDIKKMQSRTPTSSSQSYTPRTSTSYRSPSLRQSPQTGSRMGGMNNGGGQPPRLPRRMLPFGNGFGGGGGFLKGGAQLGRVAALFAPGTPGFWALVIAIIIFLILIIFLLIFSYNEKTGNVTVTVTKTGPTAVPNPESLDVETADPSDINYQIKVSWTGGPSQIVVTDKIPENTSFVSAGGAGNPTYDPTTRTVTWRIAGGGSGGGVAGDIASLLPNPVPADPSNAASVREQVVSHFQANPELIQHYKDASGKTGIPWQVYAGLHWRESDATPGRSLTSGRPIGGYEPDPAAGGDCTGPVGAVDGKPDTDCTFADAVDDIMYASDHLVGKISKMPQTHEELSEALARYNGYPGRSNCDKGSPLYSHCPPLFPGEDNSYVFTFFDEKHAIMDEIYCADGQLCGSPLQASRPGAMSVIKWVAQDIQ